MSEVESYLTISNSAEGFYKEKGSKFLAFARPVGNEEEVRRHLEDLRKKYHDARHHCFAYIIGPEQSHFRANDDGEPGHSAGDPILGQIRSRSLTNVLVIVVRYFGGTKLGVPGLINAYRVAAADALDKAGKKRIDIVDKIFIQFTYDITGEIMPLMNDCKILNQEFTEKCSLEIEIKTNQVEELISKLDVLKQQKKPIKYEIKKAGFE
jgi:uncharacterized YigZ family protein